MDTNQVSQLSPLRGKLGDFNVFIGTSKPSWIEDCAIDEFREPIEVDASGGSKVLLVEDKFLVSDHEVAAFRKTVRQVITMEAVQENANIFLNFNPKESEIHINEIVIIRQREIIDRMQSSEIQVLRRERRAERGVLSGDITLSIVLDDIRINDVIVLSYTIIDRNQLHVEYFDRILQLDYGVPIYKFSLSLLVDKDKAMQYKFFDSTDALEIKEFQEKQFFSISKINLSAGKARPYQPYWYPAGPYLQIGYKKSWKSFAVLNASFYEKVVINEPALIQLIEEIKSKALTKEQVVLGCVEFIQKNIRYLSSSTATDFIRPADPNIIVKRLYGDCKDFVYVLHTLLLALNISSVPVLVSTNMGRMLKDFLPSASVFNHIIIRVKLDDVGYFIDPTIRQKVELLKYSYLPDYGYGLICDNFTEELIEVKNQFSIKESVTVSDEYQYVSLDKNEMLLKADVTYHGSRALNMLQYVENQTQTKFWDSIKQFYSKFIVIAETLQCELDFSQIGRNEARYVVQYRISLKDFRKNGRLCFYNVFPMNLADLLYYTLPEEMNSDFYFGLLVLFEYKINILDKNMRFAQPIKTELSDPSFVFSKIAQCKKGMVEVSYHFERSRDVVLQKDYSEFLLKQKKLKSLLGDAIKTKTGWRFGFSRGTYYILCIFVFVVIRAFLQPSGETSSSPSSQPAANSTSLQYDRMRQIFHQYNKSDGNE